MSALVEVGRDISASLDAATVLEGIATHAMDLLKGDLSALFLPEGDGRNSAPLPQWARKPKNFATIRSISAQAFWGTLPTTK